MKLVIFSHSGLLWTSEAEYRLDWIRQQHGPFDELVHAGDTDIDEAVENWAEAHDIPTRTMEPDYVAFGSRAPMWRNQDMVNHVGQDGVCVAFTGHSELHDGLLRALPTGMVVYRFDMDASALSKYNAERSKMEPVDVT